MSDTEQHVLDAARVFHDKWMALVNFRHPHQFSSHALKAIEAQRAYRQVRDEYDQAFGQFTAACELHRQGRMG